MLKVLFIDDEINVLNGIKRTLYSYRNEWKMFFTTDSEEALKILENEQIDVVVSEINVFTVKGEQFLERVKEVYPSVIRIIFTDETNKEKLLNSLRLAHYFLDKPFTPEELKSKIEQGFYVQSILKNKQLKEIISRVDSLPSLPEIYLQINSELSKPDFSLKRISYLIEKDMSMSAEILRIVNSGFIGVNRKVNSIFEAVKLIGIETIKSLVLTLKIFTSFGKSKEMELLLTYIQLHSFSVARGAKKYAKLFMQGKVNLEKAFLAGMFHDIGKVIILTSNSLSKMVLEKYNIETNNILAVEKSTLGVTHAEIGAYLLSLWGMPYDIVEAVAFHHAPEKIKQKKDSLPFAVYIANIASEISKINFDYLKKINFDKDFWEIISLLKNQRS